MKRALVVSICAAYGLFCVLTLPPGPITAPDSPGYLAMFSIHTLGYPLFLKLFGANGAIVVQPALYAIALACLGLETLQITSSVTVAVAVVVASIAIPDLHSYHASILSDSLFMSGVVMFLALATRFVRKPSLGVAASASLTAGLAATVRRTGLALLPVLVVMTALQWKRLPSNRRAILAAALAPMLGVLVFQGIATRVIHGDSQRSILGRHLVAKAGLIDAPPAAAPPRDARASSLEHQLEVGFAPIRAFVAHAPADLRGILTLYYETCLQGPCVREFGSIVAGTEGKAMNDDLVRAGADRIRRAPLNYARLTARNYASFWRVLQLRHPVRAPALTQLIASSRPLPFEKEAFKLNPEHTLVFRPFEPVRYVQPIVMLIGWLTAAVALGGVVAAVMKRELSPAFSVAVLAALTAHSALLFSALTAAGLARFAIGVWPAVTTSVLFAFGGLLLRLGRAGRA